MEKLSQHIEQHYFRKGLYEDIIDRLKDQGIDLSDVSRSHIAGTDEFHVRGAAVSRELARAINLKGVHVLDVGCGLGGPCRMLADEFDCHVTGLDLSKEYIRTAIGLSKLVKLDHKTKFIVGDAVNLPFQDHSFDLVWTQHVQMNIPDKNRFYSEIQRVLKPGGVFLYYDIFKNNDRAVEYPMPWATSAELSFLFRSMEMNEILMALGFEISEKTNQTRAGIVFFEALLSSLKENGPPRMGLNVLMGDSTGPKLLNLLSHLKNDALMLESGIYRKL